MKTHITFNSVQSNFNSLMLFIICFLFSLNSHSQKAQTLLGEIWKNGTWVNVYKISKTYDGNGYFIQELYQGFDVTWKDQSRTDYNNNPDGTLQQSISQSWNPTTNKWELSRRTTDTYTAAKKVHTSEIEIWFDPNLTPTYSKVTHTYDGNNYETNSLTQVYDFTSSSLKDKYRITYSNNPDGTVSQYVTESWDTLTWNYIERITNTYNNSKLTIQLYEKWNGTIWENMERVTNTHNNSKITELREKWTGTIWENVSMETEDYDGSGNLTLSLSQYWRGGSWKNDTKALYANNADGSLFQLVSQEWDDTGMVWKNVSRFTTTYGTLGVDEHVFEKSFTAYPNPAQDKITIKTDNNNVGLKYLVTDQLGRQFLNGTIAAPETVLDFAQFSHGIYFIQVEQNKNETIKLVKQ